MAKRIAKKRNFRQALGSPDFILLILTLVFLIFGLIMIFEASIFNADRFFGDRFYFVKQQAVWIIIGLAAGSFFYFWDYHRYSKLVVPAMLVTVALLILVLFVGTEINGSRRWFEIAGIPVQPAELAKPVFILYLASWLSKDRIGFKSIRDAIRYHFIYQLGAFLLLLLVVGGLIIAEPDLGTTVIICVVAFAIYFSSGTDLIHTAGSFLIILVGGLLGTLAAVLESYRVERIRTFVQLLLTGQVEDPYGKGYQIQQILIGIGSGGFWGQGFGQSRQRFGYLAENTAFTDSIFAIILEELGMIGGIAIVLLFLLFLYRGYKVAMKAPDKLGQLLAGGIVFWLVLQAFMHMAANLALIPLTGVPLTFFTYGGSSTIVALIGVGMLLNVSRQGKE